MSKINGGPEPGQLTESFQTAAGRAGGLRWRMNTSGASAFQARLNPAEQPGRRAYRA